MAKEENLIIESVKLTNPDKLLFEKPKITKREVALYYQKVATRMMPFLKNRLISSVRCPDGINGTCFYKKHLEKSSRGIKTINIPNENGNKEDYYYITNVSGLISEVQMNTIEFHIWGSKVTQIDKPDIMIFDLDPDDKLDLTHVRKGVKDLKSILDELSLVSFLKTSGGKGYHIVIPFKPSASWTNFKEFAKNIATLMEDKWPDRYTTNVRKIKRKNKIFIDWIRNNESATSVAPYSMRIKKNASISMPIKWSELDKVEPDSFTMNDVIKRLNQKDPWENFFKINQHFK